MASDFKRNNGDEWWKCLAFVDGFNAHHHRTVAASRFKIINELMSLWVPKKGTGEKSVFHHPKITFIVQIPNPTNNVFIEYPGSGDGAIPNLTYILCKPEPLGTELKSVACPVTGIFLGLEIQRGREKMKQ